MDTDFQQRVLTAKVVMQYKAVLIEGLQNSFTGLSIKELSDAIDYSILQRVNHANASLATYYNK